MGAVLLALLYCATALALAALARTLAGRWPGPGPCLILSLLPLVYTAAGFLPQRTLAPTVGLAGIVPWADPVLAEAMREGSSPENPLLLDPMSQMEPWRRAARDDLLFNPAQGAGAALLGNGQSAALFPLEVAARLLPPVRATTYLQAARLLLAVWGAFLLGRGLALSETAALVAASAYSGAGFLQLWRAHPHSYVAAVAPWIVLALISLGRRPGLRSAVALAAAGAVGLYAGHPETLLQVLCFGLLVLAPVVLGGGRRRAVAAVGWGVVAALLAALLAAPALLPLVETLRASAEWAVRRTLTHDVFESPLYWSLVRLVPAVSHLGLGDPIAGTWEWPENLIEVGGGSLGGAVLVLVPAAFVRRRWRLAATLAAAGLLGLLVAAHMPWLSKPFAFVPLLRETLLKRLSLWWALAASVLAGLGVEALARGRGRRAVAVGAVVLAALLAAVALAFPTGRAAGALALEGGGLAAGAVAALWLGRADRAGRRWGASAALALLVAAVLVPRATLFARWIPVASSLSFYPRVGAVEFVRQRAAGYRVAGLRAALVPHSAAFFGLEEVRAYDPMTFAPYEAFARAFGSKDRIGWQRIDDPARPALSFLGVRYLFAHPAVAAELPAAAPVYADPGAVVLENPAALPRLFVPRRYRVFDRERRALAAAVEIGDFAAEAAAWGPGLPPAGLYDNPAAEVSELSLSPRGRVAARVRAAEACLAVTSQPAIPGWQLTVDGVAARPVRVNGAFLGAYLPPGEHRLEFRFAPRSWRWGLALGALGLAAVAGLWAAGRRSGGAR